MKHVWIPTRTVLEELLVPLNREALTLEQSPSAVATARRWVAEACRDLGRSDLVDCAELGVSELVTNAILHGEAPLNVRLRGTAAHPRIEVFDSSLHPPIVPDDEHDMRTGVEHELATYGRGLAMVSMAATAWGAAIEEHGKVVWFEPSPHLRDTPVHGVVQASSSSDWEPLPDSVTITLIDVDAALLRSVVTQYSNLRRELRLLALAHDTDYPLARDLSPLFATFERQFPPRTLSSIRRRLADAPDETPLTIAFAASPRSSKIFRTMLEMFSLADAFCHTQHLLSLARTPEQTQLQEWLLAQFQHQRDGGSPTAWPILPGGRHYLPKPRLGAPSAPSASV